MGIKVGLCVLVSSALVMAGVAQPPPPAVAAVEDLLSCSPTSPYVYNLRSPDNPPSGAERLNRVERYDVTDPPSGPDEADVIADFTGEIDERINGLGIGRDDDGNGRYLLFVSSDIDRDVTRNIYRYDLLTQTLETIPIPHNVYVPDSEHVVRHGAVDQSTGVYYFTTHRTGAGQETLFTLIAYNAAVDPGSPFLEDGSPNPDYPENVWIAGTVNTPDAPGVSGDLAFDSKGNIFYIVGQDQTAALYTGPGGQLPTNPEQPDVAVVLAHVGDAAGAGSNGVGVAYGQYGYLYESYVSANVREVDPSTGADLATLSNLGPGQTGSGSGSGGASTDLASCIAPSTLTVRKNVTGRENPDDQFSLSLTRRGDPQNPTTDPDIEVGEPAQTSGDDLGIQEAQVGPLPILTTLYSGEQGRVYHVEETGASGTDLGDYLTTYRCVDDNDPSFGPIEGTLAGEERGFDLTLISREGRSRAIVCTFTNAPPSTPNVFKAFGDDAPSAILNNLTYTGGYTCVTPDDARVEGTWRIVGGGYAAMDPVPDVPIGSECTITEDELGQEQLPDASWGWEPPGFDPDDATITIQDDSDDPLINTVTVTNSVTQATAELNIEKDLPDGAPDWLQDVEFTGTWVCRYAGIDGRPGTDDDVADSGTWSVTGAGTAALTPDEGSTATAVPVTSECVVNEDPLDDADLPDDTWTWEPPVYDPESPDGSSGVVVLEDSGDPEANTVTVTNSVTQATAELNIVKDLPDAAPDDVTFTGTWTCTYDGGSDETTNSGTWSVTGSGAATLTPDEGSTATAIPVTSECVVVEDSPSGPDESWEWEPPVYDPESPDGSSGLVVLEDSDDPGANTVTVSNAAARVFGGFSVVKDVVGEADPANRYAGTWECAYSGDDPENPVVRSGEWGPVAAGEVWTVTTDAEIPLGSVCEVTAETSRPDRPFPDSSLWVWDGDPDLGESVTASDDPRVERGHHHRDEYLRPARYVQRQQDIHG
ncbi:DUF5979 domain-containing protein [Phytoactinopolyspora halotolerans]|uniref:Ig-like domain-containing protein n=1 Tax=Phytoactinopolyspora halotolerans TaxID=1981512 RepID=A0A6L9SFQ6_9ACTN|nr:DUF5979 domain-containing protein [Phytoactinopolyspora halotolerans]NEE03468.1 hypothetical protein [Phytoactinopolyspora halotolerans]